MNDALPVLDSQLAIDNAGGSIELARDLHRMLQDELPQYLNRIRTSYQQQDYAQLSLDVHKLNGSATYCGVPALKRAAHAFDSHLKQHADEHYAADLGNLLTQIERVMQSPPPDF